MSCWGLADDAAGVLPILTYSSMETLKNLP